MTAEIVCYCKNVSKTEILKAIANGASSLKDIQKQTGACTGNQCKELNPSGICCSADIKKLLNKPEDDEKSCNCCSE